MPGRHSYEIGWICARAVELAAAQAMLDIIHPPLPNLIGDRNTYLLGSIGDQNVVIACLPAGVYGLYGTTAAAATATQMRLSYGAIKCCLLVGIGGGAPSSQCDIRLGDVIVSEPTMRYGGVMQYDHGKVMDGGRFVPTGTMDKPPEMLLKALARLKAEHMVHGTGIQAIYTQTMDRYPSLRETFFDPSKKLDRLFLAGYTHVGSASHCSQCDLSMLSPRQGRPRREPEVFYGLIASANTDVRDARLRDQLAQDHGILCFEMEAAGLMNNFPCLVVRGVCDYSDSHKNKQWQGYGAIMAAAYAKELILCLPSHELYEPEDVVNHTIPHVSDCESLCNSISPSNRSRDETQPGSAEGQSLQGRNVDNSFSRDSHPSNDQYHVVLYYVTCSRKANHESHKELAVYLDNPRLFEGDSKMSALRGQSKIDDVPKYLMQQEKTIFIVKKWFQCTDHLETIEDLFHPLQTPRDPEIPDSVRPYFFVLREHSPLAKMSSETMELLSESLHETVGKVTGMTYDDLSRLDQPRNMKMMKDLLYYVGRSEDSSTTLTQQQRFLLSILMDYMESTNREAYEEVDRLLAKGLITKEYLPRLYGPKQVLVTSVDGHPRAYMLECVLSSPQPISMELWSWQFDGVFSKKRKDWHLEWPSSVPPDQPIPSSSLEIYPLRYAPTDTLKRLKARGHTFWKCRHPRYVAHDSPNASLEANAATPRYMVDMKAYQKMHGAYSDKDDLGTEAMQSDDPPDTSFVLLLPHEIYGFGMHDKKWRTLLVENIKEINWYEGAFDQLVLQQGKKELIQALVTVHIQSTRSADIIAGKGNALVLLLHGGAGTGKTLTAESVAELTRKPLYRVTCGDIGTNAEEVEKHLESILTNGTKWGSVVLLDEADIFLEERRETDLQRNALVSVFLRVLEYYNGILILTSNRVGTIDSAFKSRFHLAVHYPTLDHQGRCEIWLNFINGLGKTNPDVDIDDLKSHIQDLAAVELNGRQIRNMVSTSLQLAHFRQTTLNYEHLKQVIGVAEEFEKHMEATSGYSDLDWTQNRGI